MPDDSIPEMPARRRVLPPDAGASTTDRVHAGEAIGRQLDATTGEAYIPEERPSVASGETRRRRWPGEIFDQFYLSPEDKQIYGIEGAIPASLADTDIKGDLVYIVMRAPAAYGAKDAMHIRRKRLTRPSLKFVTDPNTNQPVYATEDLVFATVTREEYLGRLGNHNKHCEVFTRGVIDGAVETDEAAAGVIEEFKGDDPVKVRKKVQETRSMLGKMKTKWPPGMTIEQIETHMEQRTVDIERRAARGGRSERPGEYEAYEARRAEAAKAKKGKRAFSFPGSPTT